jgi:hypothetical protein
MNSLMEGEAIGKQRGIDLDNSQNKYNEII